MPNRSSNRDMVHGLHRIVSRSRRATLRRLLVTALSLPAVFFASSLEAQLATVVQEENFRNEPNGGLLAVFAIGAPLTFHEQRENWIAATVEGWVWTQSLQVIERPGYDLIVSESAGENLRERPSGEILGRLEEGTLLKEIERIPGWVRVRRRGWIWAASVSVDESAATPDATAAPVPVSEPATAETSATPARPATVGGGRPILTAPDGDTLSVLAPGAEASVIGREGNWARVRIEGWVWQPEGEGSGDETTSSLEPEDVAAAPDAARGRIVAWDLQFISLERAEAVRTDFYEGEPFLLTRPAGDEGGRFIYVALPPEQLEQVGALVPLQRIQIVARVRTGASRLTGSPILDLIEIRD